MKTKLTLRAVDGGAFNCMPSREVELADANVLCNNVVFPWEFNPHKVKLYLIGNEFGAVAAVWADSEQNAWDELIDSGLGDSFLVAEDDIDAEALERGDYTCLGNASEPCNLDYAWMQEVRLDPALDYQLLCAFAEARGAGQTTLSEFSRT